MFRSAADFPFSRPIIVHFDITLECLIKIHMNSEGQITDGSNTIKLPSLLLLHNQEQKNSPCFSVIAKPAVPPSHLRC